MERTPRRFTRDEKKIERLRECATKELARFSNGLGLPSIFSGCLPNSMVEKLGDSPPTERAEGNIKFIADVWTCSPALRTLFMRTRKPVILDDIGCFRFVVRRDMYDICYREPSRNGDLATPYRSAPTLFGELWGAEDDKILENIAGLSKKRILLGFNRILRDKAVLSRQPL
ncbi:hypothetical protein CMO96_03140 [Candidatus Woesebacteria bacterium]|nr:hypothetical protein [Candidatus Woesebacteria bacterium]|tara:strand:- start:2793 stop:3308 length:516 start_codon:yes stop_codon:yes gene_type:complete